MHEALFTEVFHYPMKTFPPAASSLQETDWHEYPKTNVQRIVLLSDANCGPLLFQQECFKSVHYNCHAAMCWKLSIIAALGKRDGKEEK